MSSCETTWDEAVIDPFSPPADDDESMQRFAERVAMRCQSRYAPCGGCLQGATCDNADGHEEREDDELNGPLEPECQEWDDD